VVCGARFRLGWVLGSVLAGSPCLGGAVETVVPGPDEVRANDSRTERRSYVVARARISYPQRVSVGAGAFFVRQPVDHECVTACYFRGLLVQVEPGLDGGQLSAGYAVAVGETLGAGRFVRSVHVGYAFKGAVLRTWGDADVEPRDETYAGVEAEFTIVRVNFSLAVFRRLADDPPGDRWLLAGGLGWGF